VNGIGFWFKRRGGGKVLQCCFSKMMSFDLISEILKPQFESQVAIDVSAVSRSLCADLRLLAQEWMLKSSTKRIVWIIKMNG